MFPTNDYLKSKVGIHFHLNQFLFPLRKKKVFFNDPRHHYNKLNKKWSKKNENWRKCNDFPIFFSKNNILSFFLRSEKSTKNRRKLVQKVEVFILETDPFILFFFLVAGTVDDFF